MIPSKFCSVTRYGEWLSLRLNSEVWKVRPRPRRIIDPENKSKILDVSVISNVSVQNQISDIRSVQDFFFESEISKIFSMLHSKTRSGEWMNLRQKSEMSFEIFIALLLAIFCPVSWTDQWSGTFKFHNQFTDLRRPFKIFVSSEADVTVICSKFCSVFWSG